MPDIYLELINRDAYAKQRKWLALAFVSVLFLDIFTTYFGITVFHFNESITWTQHILTQWGWNGIIIRYIISCGIFMLIFKYSPNLVIKWTSPVMWIMLAVYMLESSVNNTILMIGE